MLLMHAHVRKPGRTKRSGTGASLLEVLVSILLISFGLLAMAALNGAAVRYNKTSEFRTIAAQLANDYVDRMRANKDGFELSAYDVTAEYEELADQTVPPCATPTSCTAAEIAAIDKAEWLNAVKDALPGGNAFIKREGTTSYADLWVVWLDPDSAVDLEDPVAAGECPADLGDPPKMPRCMFFRVGL